MSADACAQLVQRGDPDRWRTAMLAPVAARDGLMALYAFNLEVARAPWMASEPMLAEIRLQWWADALGEIHEGRTPRRHEVALPLARVIAEARLPHELFEEMIAARLFDAGRAPHANRAAVESYVGRTSGHLMELAARTLAADEAALPVVRRFAHGAGVAAYLRALPELRRRRREPLPPGINVAKLAIGARREIAAARRRRERVPSAMLPALLVGWMADTRLRRASDLEAIHAGRLEVSPFRERASLLFRAVTGRW